MKRMLILLALSTNVSADPLLVVPAYPDPDGFYARVHCTGKSLYDVCPTKVVVDYHIIDDAPKAPKQIHLPRTDTRAQMRKIDPNEDYRYSYRVQ